MNQIYQGKGEKQKKLQTPTIKKMSLGYDDLGGLSQAYQLNSFTVGFWFRSDSENPVN